MRNQVRILVFGAILALIVGWRGLRHGNDALERRLAAAPAVAGEHAP